MNLRNAIAASLLTLAAATVAHAGDLDSYPRPDWNPNASDYLYKQQNPYGHGPAMTSSNFDARMQATGSGTEFCVEPYALNPREGTNGHAGVC